MVNDVRHEESHTKNCCEMEKNKQRGEEPVPFSENEEGKERLVSWLQQYLLRSGWTWTRLPFQHTMDEMHDFYKARDEEIHRTFKNMEPRQRWIDIKDIVQGFTLHTQIYHQLWNYYCRRIFGLKLPEQGGTIWYHEPIVIPMKRHPQETHPSMFAMLNQGLFRLGERKVISTDQLMVRARIYAEKQKQRIEQQIQEEQDQDKEELLREHAKWNTSEISSLFRWDENGIAPIQITDLIEMDETEQDTEHFTMNDFLIKPTILSVENPILLDKFCEYEFWKRLHYHYIRITSSIH